MNKKLLVVFCAVFILTLILCTTAFAERYTECPVNVGSTTINEFETEDANGTKKYSPFF